MSTEQMLLCTNCGKDPQEEDTNWCIACLMYVEPPLDNDELVRVRTLLMRPRRAALSMLIFGPRFAGRCIREADGDHDWFTHLKVRLWDFTHPKARRALEHLRGGVD